MPLNRAPLALMPVVHQPVERRHLKVEEANELQHVEGVYSRSEMNRSELYDVRVNANFMKPKNRRGLGKRVHVLCKNIIINARTCNVKTTAIHPAINPEFHPGTHCFALKECIPYYFYVVKRLGRVL